MTVYFVFTGTTIPVIYILNVNLCRLFLRNAINLDHTFNDDP